MLIFIIFYFIYGFFQNILFKKNSNSSLNSLLFINSVNEIPKNKNTLENITIVPKSQSTNKEVNNTNKVTNNSNRTTTSSNKTNLNITNSNNAKTNSSKNNNLNKTSDLKTTYWKINIPSIGLDAPIAEGTSQDVMNKYVGHFENTDLWNGNVALAAHNRGYPVNYFANIKNLKKGQIIQYFYQENIRQYKIETVTVIKDTDWTYLKKSLDNRITLITCVENEPEYRRCIQAVEI